MKAIIMAGGMGKRLKSVSGDLPKPMVPLAGKPVLEHILLLLRRNGIREVCLTLHYRPEAITSRFGDGSALGMRLQYQIEREPLGTAGGVKACSSFYGDRDFLVISGDAACDFDLKMLAEAHHRHHPAVTMALHPHSEPLPYGTVLTDPLGRVIRFVEKPGWEQVVTDMINTGIYVVSPAAMALVPEGTAFDFSRDLFPALLSAGMEIRALPMEGYWCDIGSPRAYYQCNLDALDGRLRLEEGTPEEAPAAARPAKSGILCALPCRNRARAMRYISQAWMEAGADFHDGLRIATDGGRVHIFPDPAGDQICIQDDGADPTRSRALADRFAREWEERGFLS